MKSHTSRLSSASSQAGSMLLEGLIAILIFSLGILAIVGLQASAVRASSEAKYRSEASMIANRLVGQMRVSSALSLQSSFTGGGGTDGATYTTWATDMQAVLPGSSVYPPVVSFGAGNVVTITVNWLAPGEAASATPHNYTVVTQIQ